MALSYGKNGLVLAVAVAILLIGTATGNALLMFVLAAVALTVFLVFYRRESGQNAALAAVIAAAAIAAFGIARLMR